MNECASLSFVSRSHGSQSKFHSVALDYSGLLGCQSDNNKKAVTHLARQLVVFFVFFLSTGFLFTTVHCAKLVCLCAYHAV